MTMTMTMTMTRSMSCAAEHPRCDGGGEGRAGEGRRIMQIGIVNEFAKGLVVVGGGIQTKPRSPKYMSYYSFIKIYIVSLAVSLRDSSRGGALRQCSVLVKLAP